MALTFPEKFLIYLGRFNPLDYENEYVAPFDITQDGIAIAMNISRAHASIVLKRLREKELVGQRLAHQSGGHSRRYVYLITSKGQKKRLECLEKMEREGLTVDELFPQEPIVIAGPDPSINMAYSIMVDACSKLNSVKDEKCPNVTEVTGMMFDALRILNNWATAKAYGLQKEASLRIRIEDKP